MMKKMKFFTVFLITLLTLVSCGTSSSGTAKTDSSTVKVESTKESTESNNKDEKVTTEKSEQSTKAPIEEKDVVIWKGKYCTIHYKGIEKSDMDNETEIKVYIENKAKKDIVVQVESMTINDYTVEPICSIHINNGKKANDTISVSSSELEKNNLTQEDIKNIEIQFNICDKETFEEIDKSDTVKITL